MARADVPRLVIKVFLYGIEPEIWRRFSILADASFGDLHTAIQQSMGWEDQHLHEFRHGKGKRLVSVIGPAQLAEDMPGAAEFDNEDTLSLAAFIGRRVLPVRLLYRYDFGDEWVHEVVFEERASGPAGKPVLLGGARACPPEDCGGAWTYNRIVAGECDWWDDDDWDPEKFDPKKARFR